MQDILIQTGQKNKQLKSDIKKRIEFKENMVEKLQKTEGENRGSTKDITNMRAVITTLAPIHGEEGTKTIEDLKIEMIIMEEDNIKLFNEEEKTYFKEDSKKAFKIGKISRLGFK